MNIVDIIILRFNMTQMEDDCVEAVNLLTRYPHIITQHDNYPQNENIGTLWNKLINKSKGSHICLLNSDTIVSPFWLMRLMETFEKENKVGAVSPSTNRSKNQQSSLKKLPLDYGIEEFKGYECISGFCLLFPKTLWKATGGFPEDMGFYGQEVVFLDKIRERGYKQIWRKDVFVWHFGSATAKELTKKGKMDELAERRKARAYFEKRRKHEDEDI